VLISPKKYQPAIPTTKTLLAISFTQPDNRKAATSVTAFFSFYFSDNHKTFMIHVVKPNTGALLKRFYKPFSSSFSKI
jgi:hypothetical protein